MSRTPIFADDDLDALPIGAHDPEDCDLCGKAARIAALSPDQMAAGLLFLATLSPQAFEDALRVAAEAPDEDRDQAEDAIADALHDLTGPESYCRACSAPVARFESRGGEWTHYTGDPLYAPIQPYDEDHRPVLGWRPALGLPDYVTA